MEWQPIKTCPIDVDVLVYSKPCQVNMALNQHMPIWLETAIAQRSVKSDKKGRASGTIFLFRVGNQLKKRATAIPTHWMPLPPPPKAS
jgi:hypothetical protein